MVRSICSMVLFNPVVALLIFFYLNDQSVDESELFKLPTIIEAIFLCPFPPCCIWYVCIYHCYIFLVDFSLYQYIITLFDSFTNFGLMSASSGTTAVAIIFFQIPFPWSSIFCLGTFSLILSLRCVSCSQQIIESHFKYIQPVFIF